MSTITSWLHEHGLGKYADTFLENEVDMRGLPLLSDDDLKELGLPLGARRSLQAAIASIPAPGAEQEPLSAERESTPHSDAERRHLTVMFCDLVDSTALSNRMDPEDFRSVIGAYQGAVTEAVKRYDGYIARYMGDGLLVYFGYPNAHEEDAERAVRAGLDTINAISRLDTATDTELNVRVGIATGVVVVGDIIGEGSSEERAVLGDVPNLASRLQGMASPGTMLVSDHTHDLVRGRFVVRQLDDLQLKGIAEPVTAFEVTGLSDTPSRFEAAAELGLATLVGRKEEIELLRGRWGRARDGEGQLILLSGEPGVSASPELSVPLSIALRTKYRTECFSFAHRTISAVPFARSLISLSAT
jgi:class 3 adenylate cyclase